MQSWSIFSRFQAFLSNYPISLSLTWLENVPNCDLLLGSRQLLIQTRPKNVLISQFYVVMLTQLQLKNVLMYH